MKFTVWPLSHSLRILVFRGGRDGWLWFSKQFVTKVYTFIINCPSHERAKFIFSNHFNVIYVLGNVEDRPETLQNIWYTVRKFQNDERPALKRIPKFQEPTLLQKAIFRSITGKINLFVIVRNVRELPFATCFQTPVIVSDFCPIQLNCTVETLVNRFQQQLQGHRSLYYGQHLLQCWNQRLRWIAT